LQVGERKGPGQRRAPLLLAAIAVQGGSTQPSGRHLSGLAPDETPGSSPARRAYLEGTTLDLQRVPLRERQRNLTSCVGHNALERGTRDTHALSRLSLGETFQIGQAQCLSLLQAALRSARVGRLRRGPPRKTGRLEPPQCASPREPGGARPPLPAHLWADRRSQLQYRTPASPVRPGEYGSCRHGDQRPARPRSQSAVGLHPVPRAFYGERIACSSASPFSGIYYGHMPITQYTEPREDCQLS